MKHFDIKKLLPGDIIGVRTQTGFGRAIRLALGSYTNHNAMILKGTTGYIIGEAVEPYSKITSLDEYDGLLNAEGCDVRVWRVPGLSYEKKLVASHFFAERLLGLPYPSISIFRLWVFRVVNSLPWKIHGQWCTRLVWEAYASIDPGIFDRPDGKRKKNPTPRTLENRLVAGVITDVTRGVITEPHKA